MCCPLNPEQMARDFPPELCDQLINLLFIQVRRNITWWVRIPVSITLLLLVGIIVVPFSICLPVILLVRVVVLISCREAGWCLSERRAPLVYLRLVLDWGAVIIGLLV